MSALTPDHAYFRTWDKDSVLVVSVGTVTIYNAVELLLMIFSRFREYRSLLFISLVVSTCGVFPYETGLMLEYFRLVPFWASMLTSTTGWVMLITGQSVVLYSRLHLITNDTRILRSVKWMIIIDALLYHPSTTVIQFCRIYTANESARLGFERAMFYIEKIQMTGFCVQEFIISGIYMWKTLELLKVTQKKHARRVMWELFAINVIIVAGDVALLVLEFGGQRTLERVFKPFVYGVKLKLEFAILSKLVDLVQSSQRNLSLTLADTSEFVDVTRTNTAMTVQDYSSRTYHPQSRTTGEEIPDWLAKLEGTTNVQHLETVDTIRSTSPSVSQRHHVAGEKGLV